VTGGEKCRLLISQRAFAKPKTDAREGKKSLSKSISNGLKKGTTRKQGKSWSALWFLCVEGVKREESQAEKRRELFDLSPPAAKISALLSRKGFTGDFKSRAKAKIEDNSFTELFCMTFCRKLSRAK
jgi:hypothetical protein